MTNTFDRHTIHRFDEELHYLHMQVVEMGESVLNQLKLALESLHDKDSTLAQEIINRERVVNEMEVSIDTLICSILVKRSPKASDLRTVLAASKIVNNLERIGDEAAKIANFVTILHSHKNNPATDVPLDNVLKLVEMSIDIVKSALDVLNSLDVERAEKFSELHQSLDRQFQHGLHDLMSFLQETKSNVSNAVSLVLMMKSLERIGDHAQRIAEFVIYQTKGEELQHQIPRLDEDFPLEAP